MNTFTASRLWRAVCVLCLVQASAALSQEHVHTHVAAEPRATSAQDHDQHGMAPTADDHAQHSMAPTADEHAHDNTEPAADEHAHHNMAPGADEHADHSMAPAATERAMPQLPEAQRSLDTDPVYRCPMHPDVMQNEAGRCPICGMELVADTATSAPRDARPAAVQLDSAVVQTLGVRVVQVEERPRVEWISAPGRMAYDETRLYHLHPRAAGWIEDLRIRAEGDPVSTGETLAALYAPDILSAQVNFLIALRDASDSRQVANARSLLRLLAVPDQIILDIEKTGETRNTVPVVAPSDGVITGLQARDGMYVAPETAMFTIADLSYLWLLLDVRETESALLSKGQPVEIKLDALPGRRFEGRVDYLYPQLDPQTRSRPVRVVLDNRTGELQPGLWAEARIRVGDGSTMSAIPRDALISDGRSEHVLVILEDGRFEAREIETGAVYDDWIEVLAGVRVGEHLAGSAQFLIDSESDLQAELRRLDGGAGSAGGHDHVH